MKKHGKHFVTAVLVILALNTGRAIAGSGIISYQANQNPTNQDAYVTQPGNQFWTRSTGGAGPVGTGINDGGTPAWSVARGSVGAGEEFWTVTPLAADVATGNVEGWKLSTRLRLPESGRAASFGSMVDYADGSRAWTMHFGTDGDGDPIVTLFNNSTNPSFTLEGAGNTGYHDYLLAYNPLALSANLYVDGVLRISGFVGQSVGFSRLLFGDAALSTADHDVNYNSVLLVLPEPSSLALLSLAGLALLARRRR